MPFDEQSATHAVEILKAIAHPVRLRIVATLARGSEHVTGLAERLDVPQAIVSQQLRFLRITGLVESSREGGFAVYRLLEPNLVELMETMERCCARRRARTAANGDVRPSEGPGTGAET